MTSPKTLEEMPEESTCLGLTIVLPTESLEMLGDETAMAPDEGAIRPLNLFQFLALKL
jgi:hypothetical protein